MGNFLRVAGFFLALGCPWAASMIFAQDPGELFPEHAARSIASTPTPIPQPNLPPDIQGWSSFYAGEEGEASEAASRLAKSRDKEEQLQGLHLNARILWHRGDPASKKAALNCWDKFSREVSASSHELKLRVLVAQALQKSQANDVNDSSAILAQLGSVLNDPRPQGTAPAEAGIEMACVLVRNKRWNDAEKVLHQVLEQLHKRYIQLEITPAKAAPFIAEAERVLKEIECLREPARYAFHQAEQMRGERRYVEALKKYHSIIKDYSDTEYAPRSEMCGGWCLYGQGQADEALRHWEAFVKADPLGPWRGQARYGIVLISLMPKYDVHRTSTESAHALESIPIALNRENSRSSWEQASLSLRVQAALIAYAKGDVSQALEQFKRADECIAALRKKTDPHFLRLMQAAELDLLPLPTEVAAGNAGADSLCFWMRYGVLLLAAGNSASANTCFTNLLDGKAGKPSSGAEAFLRYGLAAAVRLEHGKTQSVTELLSKAQSLAPQAAWQDETHFMQALLAQSAIPESKGPAPETVLPAVASAAKNVVFLWDRLLTRYPQSPRRSEALYQKGAMQIQAGLEQEGNQTLAEYLEKYPDHPRAGGLYAAVIDTCVENLLDPDRAEKLVQNALGWVQKNLSPESQPADEKTATTAGSILPLWALPDEPIRQNDKKQIAYDVYLRAGMLAFLDEKYPQAINYFEAARPFMPKKEGKTVLVGSPPNSTDAVIQAARDGRPLTAKEALGGDRKVKFLIQIADIYLTARMSAKAESLYTRLLTNLTKNATRLQLSWAHYQRAEAYRLQNKCQECTRDFYAAYQTEPKAPWAPQSLYYTATVTFNASQDAARAVPFFQELTGRYPNHELAEVSLYNVAKMLHLMQKLDEAEAAYRRYMQKYPDSDMVALIQQKKLPDLARLREKERNSRK